MYKRLKSFDYDMFDQPKWALFTQEKKKKARKLDAHERLMMIQMQEFASDSLEYRFKDEFRNLLDRPYEDYSL